jgi:RNA polymerase sigma factor for flagellar operon FliA
MPAAAAGMSVAELGARTDELELAEVGSLNRTIRSEDSTTIERIDTLESDDEQCDPIVSAERSEAKERFRKAFAELPARERQVAVLLYVEGRTLRDIGTRLGVSESRVSQIHTELRGRLRDRLAGDRALFGAVV